MWCYLLLELYYLATLEKVYVKFSKENVNRLVSLLSR